MSKKIVFSLSKAMTIILATVFTMLLLASCPSAEDKLAEDMLGTNTDIPAVGTEYNDEENNLRYIVNDDRTLSVKGPIDSELADWVCIIPEEYEGIKVTSIGKHAFLGCSKLASITIPGSVTSIGSYAFYDCYSLTSITVSDNNKYYKSIDGVLFDKNVQKIIAYPCSKSSNYYTIPDSITSIGDGAFRDCYSLNSITIPDSVTSIGDYTFFYCYSLTSITVSDNNKYYKSIDGVLFDNNVQKIIAYPCGKSSNYYTIPDSVTSIGSFAFEGCSNLNSITIPDSITSIGNFAFYGCSGLTSITVSGNNKYYKSIDGVLFDKNVQKIIAYPCSKSSNYYTIPDSVTSIGDGAFRECSSLTEIHINKPENSISGSPWRAPNGESIVKWQGQF